MSNLDPDIWLENPFDGSGADSKDCIDCIECVGGGAAGGASDNPVARLFHILRGRALGLSGDDRGMSTVEYALGTVAAAAFGALLYTVVTGGQITDALTDIIERALNTQ